MSTTPRAPTAPPETPPARREAEDRLVLNGLMTIPQACEFLALSRSLLYLLMDRGDLPFVRINTARRIPRTAVVDLAKRGLVNSPRQTVGQ